MILVEQPEDSALDLILYTVNHTVTFPWEVWKTAELMDAKISVWGPDNRRIAFFSAEAVIGWRMS